MSRASSLAGPRTPQFVAQIESVVPAEGHDVSDALHDAYPESAAESASSSIPILRPCGFYLHSELACAGLPVLMKGREEETAGSSEVAALPLPDQSAGTSPRPAFQEFKSAGWGYADQGEEIEGQTGGDTAGRRADHQREPHGLLLSAARRGAAIAAIGRINQPRCRRIGSRQR